MRFKARQLHFLRLLDQGCFLGEDVELKELTYLFVRGRGLCNDEVQEDDAGHEEDQAPNKPVNVVLLRAKLHGSVEAEVSQRHSQGLDDVSEEETNDFVLDAAHAASVLFAAANAVGVVSLAQGGASLLVELISEIALDLGVAEADDAKQQGEEHGQDGVEEQEDSEVVDHVGQHRNDGAQRGHDLQERESSKQS